ncbi:universal stress protein [Sulfurospirillum barnesii]|uniref:Universal stress protein UspA-like protein n=1 Tax=Sulfurospirillum barnesii (strain ATCC 700032 / DSM 10660 / SES-3) TaxID=760154 RepID=I3XZU1_SULBS|nr:universal stress protein [Sulfurospirillum barnesii]AFL69465.1 universal stress protein UspA-like protein [Sulfurospirillum barnesii SES-3]
MQNFTLLVAIDFSEGTKTLLKKAHHFAEKFEATLHVVHVIENELFQKNKSHEEIAEHCWEIIHASSSLVEKKHFYCLDGAVDKTIQIVAKTIGAHMVMIGDNKEKHPLEAIFIGSDTKAIIKKSSIPVFVTKNHTLHNYTTILIPTDLSKDSALMVQHIEHLFPNALLLLLHLYSVPFEFRLGMYGFNEHEIMNFHEESRQAAETQLNLFIKSLEIPLKRVVPIVRKELLSSERFEENHKDLKADLVAIHTTGNISFFAFDLLEKSKNDVLIYKVHHTHKAHHGH